jgi:predicted metal-dependent hydrolase
MIEYQLVRSNKRKSIALQVKQGVVTVRAPYYVKESYIQQLVLEKSSWLEAKLLIQDNQLKDQQVNHQGMVFSDNGFLWFEGTRKNISLSFSTKNSIENNGNTIQVTLAQRSKGLCEMQQQKAIKRLVEAWFKKSAITLLTEKVEYFSAQLNLYPSKVNVRQYKARWGSCNNHGQVSFNYLLIMVPDWVIDYVVVHELCHLKHLNHSRQFWLLVAEFYPRFREAKHWLNTHQNHLQWPTL